MPAAASKTVPTYPRHPKFENYSRILPGEERIHESVLIPEGKLLTGPADESVKTLFDLLQRGIRVSGNGEFVGERKGPNKEYTWLRYQQMATNAQQIGSGLIALGVKANAESRVGIAGANCSEYLTATFALVSYSMINVPLYQNYKFEALIEIVNNCELEVIFCDNLERALTFQNASSEMPSLKKIIIFHTDKPLFANGKTIKGNIELIEWDYLLKLGENNLSPVSPPEPDDVYIICNTSGTTGRPKGVQLSHKAILTAMAGLYHQWCIDPNCMVFDKDDIYLSFLSPAHVYEQLMQAFIIYNGAKLGLYSGNIAKLLDDMQILKPTIVSLVPRLLNKFHDSIWAKVLQANWIKRILFRFAINAKIRHLKQGNLSYDTFWDRWILNPIRRIFGGNLRLVTSGGAPITAKVMNFSKIIYGAPLVEGYGQSECSAAGTVSMISDTGNGHVGGPAAWAQVKLADVEELNYFSADDKGEVCFRGSAIMSGYFREPELTAKAIDSDGWLHTGDI
uniref:AMP-dependent synthetase/ligase domain-containing protein n=1 Tax=Panagrolaimus sp. ES5 TaxID=591445 RepID=A0AC34G3F5_9BILA